MTVQISYFYGSIKSEEKRDLKGVLRKFLENCFIIICSTSLYLQIFVDYNNARIYHMQLMQVKIIETDGWYWWIYETEQYAAGRIEVIDRTDFTSRLLFNFAFCANVAISYYVCML